MSAASIIRTVRAAGGEITLADDRIKLKVPESLHNEVIAEIKAHKDAIKRVLKSEANDPWAADNYRAFYEERPANTDFDDGQTREEADDEYSSDISALLKAVAENPQCHSFYLAGEKVRLEASRPLPGEVRPQVRRLKPDVTEYLAGLRFMDGVAPLLTGRPERELKAAKRAVMAFMDNHLEAARCIGWSDLELFGRHPDREAARSRYDYAGAVTVAAISGHSIERITEQAAHYENGLVYYRKRPMPADAVPV
jgi:hypothetical protein